jgi:hypothetical protein
MQGRDPPKPNNLLVFMRAVARNAQSVIFGTATPIQLDAVELWDLLSALNQGAPQVLGTQMDGGEWAREESIQFLTGDRAWPQNDTNRWGLFRNPLPPAAEHAVFRDIRSDAALEPRDVLGPRFDDLGPDVRRDFLQEFVTLAEGHNPIVRRVVRRTRPMREGRGLLKRIGVITHPRSDDALPSMLFDGEGLVMSLAFNAAYEAAEAFSRLYAARRPGAGFLKTILLRRIGSSARAGLETARHLLGRLDVSLPEEEVGDEGLPTDDSPPDPQEIELLREIERNLAAVVGGKGSHRHAAAAYGEGCAQARDRRCARRRVRREPALCRTARREKLSGHVVHGARLRALRRRAVIAQPAWRAVSRSERDWPNRERAVAQGGGKSFRPRPCRRQQHADGI